MNDIEVNVSERISIPINLIIKISFDPDTRNALIKGVKASEEPNLLIRDVYTTLITQNKIKKFDLKAEKIVRNQQKNMFMRGEYPRSPFLPKDQFISMIRIKENPLRLDYKYITERIYGMLLGDVLFAGCEGEGLLMRTTTQFTENEFVKSTCDSMTYVKESENVYLLLKKGQ